MWRAGVKWCNLWQTSSRWANGQTNKLAAPLSHQHPHLWTPRPPNPSGGGFDSFIAEGLGGRRPFVSHFIQCLIPSSPFKPVCLSSGNTSMQPPPPPPLPPRALVCLSVLVLFLLSVPAGSWSYKCLDREALRWAKSLSPSAQTAVFTHAADPKPVKPQGSFFQLHLWVSLLFSVLNARQRHQGQLLQKYIYIYIFVCKKGF